MGRIERAFEALAGRTALIPFVVAGDPNYEESLSLVQAILDAGADMIELGLPYSDPLADGPVIQAAALRSLQSGFQLPQSMRMIQAIRQRTQKPIIAFTYVNPVLQYGIETFVRELAAAGGDGVIIPDVPLEEAPEIAEVARRYEIAFIPLVAPTSGEARVRAICEAATGFVYCVSSLGVTGERSAVSNNVQSLVETVKAHTDLPACVGFGVSQPVHAKEISAYADGVIVGSAYVRRIEEFEAQGPAAMMNELSEFTRALKSACK
ncbi:tryptophan synthase subunit alpha [Alicyclobacillus fastidiosus]|uniref:Tryptophan synthase alpha chain n=1 Tax=Alicyclobacillus fastidiosus TaxID=392011 RepID=A0ABY6Z9V8_9BACL|nr:tryptophan synthase subunit alpha [Alicyclobacillus fastidiosus]WAH39664.1 tryptophan synthase subunit alpha [Alicyclobacillus fastidiosus]GMA60874.1 tryptophan synthase alpha chain [Alicyclobacillus fastidiosus]